MQSTIQSLVSIQSQLLTMASYAPKCSGLKLELLTALRELNRAIKSLQSQPAPSATQTDEARELYSAYDLELDAVNANQKSH